MVKNIKKQNAWLGAFALLIMVGVATLTFAFKADGKGDKRQNKRLTTYYFQYGGSNSEAAFESSGNWTNITSVPPEESPCSGAEQIVCTLRADFESTPTSTDIANYLQGLAPLTPNGASLYCNDPSNIVYYKPN
jgi:hypothetical protein